MPIKVDKGATDYCGLIIEHPALRVTLACTHDDGMQLHQALTDYYGEIKRIQQSKTAPKRLGTRIKEVFFPGE